MAAVNGIVLAISLIGKFVFSNDFWQVIESDNPSSSIAGIGMLLYFMVYVLSVGALGFVVSLYFYVRFYNNLYTDQGYLMHTLPVTPAQLIWSKAFVGVLWHIISVAIMVLSLFSVMFSLIVSVDGTITWNDFWQEFADIPADDLGNATIIIILLIVLTIVGCFMTIFLGYTAISIGQLFKKQKILGAIGAYVVIYLVMQTAGSMATVPFSSWIEKMGESGEFSALAFEGLLAVSIIVTVLVTTGLYFFNEHIMKYKLNLE